MPFTRAIFLILVLGASIGFSTALSPALAQMSEDEQFVRDIRDRKYGEVMGHILNAKNVNVRDHEGAPAILVAAQVNEAGIVEAILEQPGAKPDLDHHESGETALMRAAASGRLQIVRILLDAGADIDRGDKQGETPLIKAVRNGQLDVIEVLIEEGADPYLSDFATGLTAVDFARRARDQRILRTLESAMEEAN